MSTSTPTNSSVSKKRNNSVVSPIADQKDPKGTKMDTQAIITEIRASRAEFRADLETLKAAIGAIDDKVTNIVKRLDKHENDISAVSERLDKAESKLNEIEQHAARNIFRIQNMKMAATDILTVTTKIFGTVGVTVAQKDFVRLFSVNNRGGGRYSTIIGEFADDNKRREAMKNYKTYVKAQIFTYGDIFVSEDRTWKAMQVIIKPQLTDYTRRLMTLGYSLKIQHVWMSEGKVLIRKQEGGKITHIKSLTQMQTNGHQMDL